MINSDFLAREMEAEGFAPTENQLEKFDRYASMLVEWNEKINLTAITEPDEIVIKHFIDSLLLLRAFPLPESASLIDVGTGAGFPSVPVAIVRPDIRLTLMDSLNKRITFLKTLTEALDIPAHCVHARAEEVGGKEEFRERYDAACARAVAHLRELSEYCLPFVKVGGVFIALKGYEIEQELSEASFAIKTLGGKVESVNKFTLPGDNKRAIVVIRKSAPTPKKYPRPSGKIKKSPLQSRA